MGFRILDRLRNVIDVYYIRDQLSNPEYSPELEEHENEEIQDTAIEEETRTIVVDTSALGVEEAFDFIMRFPKVVLLQEVIEEMESKRKERNGILSKNISKLLKENVKDVDSKKFIVIKKQSCKKRYTDDLLLEYCKDKEVVLYTGDKGLASRAKGYEIRYIFVEQSFNEKYARTIKYISKIGKELFLVIPNTYKVGFIVFKKDYVKKPVIKDSIRLKLEDNILIMTYTKRNDGLLISHFVLVNEENENHAIYLNSYLVGRDEKRISNLDFSHDVKREIKNYFMRVNRI